MSLRWLGGEWMPRCNLGDVVRLRVHQSIASPFHSVMREESTRQEFNIERGHQRTGDSTTASSTTGTSAALCPTMLETSRHYIFFPHQNSIDVRKDLDTPGAFSTVTLIGGTGFFALFFVDQCLRRGISVTVLARDVNKVKDAYVSLFKSNAAKEINVVEEQHSSDLADAGSYSLCYTSRANRGVRAPLSLELLQGDVMSPEAVRHAVREASLVIYLASAKCSKWWRPWEKINPPGCSKVDVHGLRHTVEACSLVDAHLVAFVPLLNKYSWTSPLQWYRRLFVYRFGYLKATQRQERLLLNDTGSPSALCAQYGDPLRFTLFRVNDIVYPTLNKRVTIAKNNNIIDPLHIISLRHGDIDAKILANIVMRAVGLCRSSIGSRLDVTGHIRYGVDLTHVDNFLHGLRHE